MTDKIVGVKATIVGAMALSDYERLKANENLTALDVVETMSGYERGDIRHTVEIEQTAD